MKTVLLVSLLCLSASLYAQMAETSPVVINGLGQPLAGAKVAICTQNPGLPLNPPCQEGGNSLVATYTTSSLGTPCALNPATLGPLSGFGCTNPGLTDGLGNLLVYGGTTTLLWYEVYGNSIPNFAAPLFFGSPINFNVAGVFTNTQMNEYLTSVLNGCSSSTEQQAYGPGSLATNGISSCVKEPTNVTVGSVNGIASYVQANTSNFLGSTAIIGQCRALANDDNCSGGSFLAGDQVDLNTQRELIGMGSHVITFNPATSYQIIDGVISIGDFRGVGNIAFAHAFLATSVGSTIWHDALNSADGMALNGVTLGATGSTGTAPSQGINFNGISGGVDSGISSIGAESNGNFFVSTPSGSAFRLSFGAGSRHFSTLPACSSAIETAIAGIDDALAANCGDGSCTTWGTNVTAGGGALHRGVYCDGTNWTLLAK